MCTPLLPAITKSSVHVCQYWCDVEPLQWSGLFCPDRSELMGDLASAFSSELAECHIGTNSIIYNTYGWLSALCLKRQKVVDWLVCANQSNVVCSLRGAKYPVTHFCIRIATHLLTTGDGPISFLPVLLLVSNPQHPHYRTHCFYCYFVGRARIHHTVQLNSKLNTEFDIIWINQIWLRCACCDLSRSCDFISRDLICQLSPTGYSQNPMASTYLMDHTRSYIVFML